MAQKLFAESIAQAKFEERTDPYEGFLHRTRKEAEEIAASKGCIVRAPGPRELFVDIDSIDATQRCHRLIETMRVHGAIDQVDWSTSPSGEPGHFHVVVTFHREVRSEYERIMLQALLGSDPMRELLSWRRLEDGSDADAISLFFEKAPSAQVCAQQSEALYQPKPSEVLYSLVDGRCSVITMRADFAKRWEVAGKPVIQQDPSKYFVSSIAEVREADADESAAGTGAWLDRVLA